MGNFGCCLILVLGELKMSFFSFRSPFLNMLSFGFINYWLMNSIELENRFLEYGIYRKRGMGSILRQREREMLFIIQLYKHGCLPLLLLYVIIGESSTEE